MRIATVFVVAMLFIACNEEFKQASLTEAEKKLPQGVVENLEMLYTESVRPLSVLQSDSTRVVAILRTMIISLPRFLQIQLSITH